MTTAARDYGQGAPHEELAKELVITEPGYVYLYISNDNVSLGGGEVEVYWDDFRVEHVKSPVIQSQDYYPFGLMHSSYQRESTLGNQNKYNGKELQDELSLGFYDYIAREYDPVLTRFTSIDPAADLMRRVSPYVYSFNNPIRFTDPDGMVPGDFLDEKGKNVGNDGRNDGKVYLIKTKKSKFDSGVPSAGISRKEARQTKRYIKQNSGNKSAFGQGNVALRNSVEIESSSATRQAMVNEANRDNGKRGRADASNREYGGETSVAGVFTPAQPGPVADPTTDPHAFIDIPNFEEDTKSDAHSHPSGTKTVSNGDGTTTTASFQQAPSPDDVTNSGANVNYVFGRGNGIVYIYNNTGVLATIPQRFFVKPR